MRSCLARKITYQNTKPNSNYWSFSLAANTYDGSASDVINEDHQLHPALPLVGLVPVQDRGLLRAFEAEQSKQRDVDDRRQEPNGGEVLVRLHEDVRSGANRDSFIRLLHFFSGHTQARSQVLTLGGGGKIHFRGKEFCFYYMFKTNLSEHNKFWGDAASEYPLVVTGLVEWKRRSSVRVRTWVSAVVTMKARARLALKHRAVVTAGSCRAAPPTIFCARKVFILFVLNI